MKATTAWIEDAIKGGWDNGDIMAIWHINNPHQILLDPLAWQAVGTTRGWANLGCSRCHKQVLEPIDIYAKCPEHGILVEEEYADYVWRMNWHDFINYLADGKTIEEALSAIS